MCLLIVLKTAVAVDVNPGPSGREGGGDFDDGRHRGGDADRLPPRPRAAPAAVPRAREGGVLERTRAEGSPEVSDERRAGIGWWVCHTGGYCDGNYFSQ